MFLGGPFLWFCIKSNRHKSVDTILKSPFISYKFGCTYESQDYSKKWMMTRNWAINQINYTIPWLVIMRMMRNYNLRQLCHKRSFIIIINIFISKSKYFQFLFVWIVVSHGFRDDHQKISLHSRSHKNPEDWNVSLWKTTDPKGWQYLKWPFAKKKINMITQKTRTFLPPS